MKYEYISYDVWGNDDDGYEVNQSFHTGEIVKIDPLDDDEGLIKSLQEQGFLIGAIDYDKLRIDGETGYSLYFEYEGRPEFELRPKS